MGRNKWPTPAGLAKPSMCLSVKPHSAIFNYTTHDAQPTFHMRTNQHGEPRPSCRCPRGKVLPPPVSVSPGSTLFGLFPEIYDNPLRTLLSLQLTQLLWFRWIWRGFGRAMPAMNLFKEVSLKNCCLLDAAFPEATGDSWATSNHIPGVNKCFLPIKNRASSAFSLCFPAPASCNIYSRF